MGIVMTDCTLKSEIRTARKDHPCDACDYLIAIGYIDMGLTFGELRQVAKAKRNGWKIKKGQKYKINKGIYDGEFYTFKAIPEINEICMKHDYYRE